VSGNVSPGTLALNPRIFHSDSALEPDKFRGKIDQRCQSTTLLNDQRFDIPQANVTVFESNIRIPSNVLFHDLDGEAVLLNLQTGKYFGLDAIGTRIWSLIGELGALPAVYRKMLEEYDVDAERLKADLLALIDQLAARGLIQLTETPNGHEV
jgi:hypothetical protein